MKRIFVFILLMGLLACRSSRLPAPEVSNKVMAARQMDSPDTRAEMAFSNEKDYQVALDFINAYVKDAGQTELAEFVANSPLVSERFKRELDRVMVLAWEENPEFGLMADPLFDAQDFPPLGFELLEYDAQSGYLMVKGIGWEEFLVAMRVVREAESMLVEGCGTVNIPPAKRAKR